MPRVLQHGQDAVLGVFLGRDFVREDDHSRAGREVDHLGEHVERGLRAARLRRLAQDDHLHAREAGRVHDADKVGGEDVSPEAGQGRHAHHAVAFRPLAGRQPFLAAHDYPFGLGEGKAVRGPARKSAGESFGKP